MSENMGKLGLTLLKGNFSKIISKYKNIEEGRKLNSVDGFFAYRILLGRNPDLNQELPNILENGSTYREFINTVTNSEEFNNNTSFLPPNRVWMSKVQGFRFWFNTSDREMGVRMALGCYEPRTVDLLRSIIKPGMKCIIAGAHTGYFACLMATLVGKNGKVYAFEPKPSSYALLVQNVEENGFDKIIYSYNLACSNRDAVIEATELSNMYVAGAKEKGKKVQMRGVRVDDILEGPIDVIKMDIEGHEPAGIDGMQCIITENRPMILSEINEYWLRTCSNSNGHKYMRQLDSLGYDLYDVDCIENGVIPSSLTLDILESKDVLALPKGVRHTGLSNANKSTK